MGEYRARGSTWGHPEVRTGAGSAVSRPRIPRAGLSISVVVRARVVLVAMTHSSTWHPIIVAEKKDKKKEDEIDENGQSLSTQQVETLLNILCEETDIAEIELKLDGFKMKVRRSTEGLAATAAPAAAPAAVAAPAPAPVAASPATASYDSDSDVEMEDTSAHIPVKAPKVGVMRRGRYLKGKQIGKGPVVEVGATVKKGQPLCYIEQLGTFWPVESPQAGEVGVFLVEEGDAVEYLEEIVDIAPFFGGHIIGDSKHM